MQEAFDKIIDKLQNLQKDKYVFTPIVCYALDKAIEIIRQTAAEYNNGWIPCSDKFPETVGRYLVTAVWEDGDFKKHSVYDAVYGSDGIWHVQDYAPAPHKVIAWQPLPEPYQPKER